jgi:hypothetical protein
LSKIALSGNASGTGTFTIASPDSNTDRTLNLPDAAGTVVVTGTTPALNGITVPASQVTSADANTLDDYEEGTWTPTLLWGGNAVGLTYGQRDGVYTKVGNIVTVNFTVILTNKGSSTGTGAITGFPFSVSFSNQSFFIYSDRVNFTGGVLAGYINSGATALLYNQVSGANAQIGAAEFQNDSYIYGSFTYRVA